MKLVTKLLILVLVVLMCFGSLVACGGGDETTTAATTTTTGGGTTSSTTTSSTTTSSTQGGGGSTSSTDYNVYDDPTINWRAYEDNVCTIFYRGDSWGVRNLFIREDEVGTNQADIATMARLEFFKDKTGITINGVAGGHNNYEALNSVLNSGDPANVPDILFIAGGDAFSFTFNNKLVCLNDPATPNMNFDLDCWHENLNEGLAIWGNYYMASGYWDTVNFEQAHALFFDRDALETINPETIDFATYPELAGYEGEDTIYQWAKDGEWTWDKLVALAKLFAGPDGTFVGGIPAKNGYEYSGTETMPLLVSIDLQPFKEDEFGVPTLQLDSVAQEKLDYLNDNVMYQNGAKYANVNADIWAGANDPNTPRLFGTNHTALFYSTIVLRLQAFAGYSTETVPFRYGILPMPKYNEQQENYRCSAESWYTTVACIPKDCMSIDFSTFVLQHFTEMGKYSFHKNVKTVFEAVVEDGLSGRYAATTDNAENDKEMLQIIMDSVDAWLWEYAAGQFGGAEGPKVLGRNLITAETPNYQGFQDNAAPLIRQAMYDVLIKLGLAEAS